MSKKTTIKEEMRAIDKRDFEWYNSLNEEEKKSLSMFVLMRYASSTDSKTPEINEHYLSNVNDDVNVHFNAIVKHPELQFRLMQRAGIGANQFHKWIKPCKRNKAKKANSLMSAFFLEMHPHLNDYEVAILIDNHTKEELTAMLENYGVQKKKIKDYFK